MAVNSTPHQTMPATSTATSTASSTPPSCQEATSSLFIRAVETLAQLASVDSTLYQQALTQSTNSTRDDDETRRVSVLLRDLDALLQQQQQQQQPQQSSESRTVSASSFGRLAASVQRLHAHVALLHTEAEQHDEQLAQQARQEFTVRKSLETLHGKHQALRRKYKESCHHNRQLRKQVALVQREASDLRLKEMQEWETAYRLQAHEHVLRSRTTSSDSHFSDGSQLQESSSRTTSLEWSSFPQDHDVVVGKGSNGDCEETASLPSTQSASTSSSSSSTCGTSAMSHSSSSLLQQQTQQERQQSLCCLVTDEGVATVRLQARATPEDETTTIHFQQHTKMGLWMEQVDLEHEDNDAAPPAPQGLLQTALFGPRSVALRRPTKQSSPSRAFVVQQHVAWTVHVPPPCIGARLVKLDGKAIDARWSLEQVLDQLSRLQERPEGYTVTFQDAKDSATLSTTQTQSSRFFSSTKQEENKPEAFDTATAASQETAATSSASVKDTRKPDPCKEQVPAAPQAMFGLGFFKAVASSSSSQSEATARKIAAAAKAAELLSAEAKKKAQQQEEQRAPSDTDPAKATTDSSAKSGSNNELKPLSAVASAGPFWRMAGFKAEETAVASPPAAKETTAVATSTTANETTAEATPTTAKETTPFVLPLATTPATQETAEIAGVLI